MRYVQYKKQGEEPLKLVGTDGKPLQAAYEASSTGKRLSGWQADHTSPNSADLSELEILRHRARDMERNTAWATRAITADVANEIGTGIKPRSSAPNDAIKSELDQSWRDWAQFGDADGITSIYGLQSMAARARKESGEVFIRVRTRRPQDGLPVPVQFQLIEADLCPIELNRTQPNGNVIKMGVEFNGIGQRAAYWMYKNHPTDGGNLSDMVRVPAEQIIHHYIATRPGQIRGRPVGVQAFVKAFTYDKYDDAELVRKEVRSHFTGVIHREAYDEDDYQFDPISGEPIGDDVSVPSMNLEPGTFPSLLPGEEIKMFGGDEGGASDQDFSRRQLLAVAAAYGVPFEVMTGDYSGINDRVWRAIINQYRREIEQVQAHWTIQQVCRGIWSHFVDHAVLGGLKIPDYASQQTAYKRAEYQPQAWPYIHPLQDVQSLKMLKEEGFDSRQNIIGGRGRDVETVDRQRKEDQKRENDSGLTPKPKKR